MILLCLRNNLIRQSSLKNLIKIKSWIKVIFLYFNLLKIVHIKIIV